MVGFVQLCKTLDPAPKVLELWQVTGPECFVHRRTVEESLMLRLIVPWADVNNNWLDWIDLIRKLSKPTGYRHLQFARSWSIDVSNCIWDRKISILCIRD